MPGDGRFALQPQPPETARIRIAGTSGSGGSLADQPWPYLRQPPEWLLAMICLNIALRAGALSKTCVMVCLLDALAVAAGQPGPPGRLVLAGRHVVTVADQREPKQARVGPD